MAEACLYKYLNATGGLSMLSNKTLQFTNATQLNDPFDCHPAYVDVSSNSIEAYRGLPSEVVSRLEYNKGLERREKVYLCSLSKVHDSILMWSYYSKHSGVCIGLNMEKTRVYLKQMMGLFIGCPELEVIYRNVVSDPTPFNEPMDFIRNLFATKAKEWQHEQEVRLVSYDPASRYMRLQSDQDDKNGPIPWREVRAYLEVGGECFESLYLGVSMKEKERNNLIKVARECNPDVKIYQMTIDPKAFWLKEQLIDQ